MSYHPIIGILIFLITIIISFLLGKNAFRKYKKKEKKSNITDIASEHGSAYTKPPKGDITSPDAPWLND